MRYLVTNNENRDIWLYIWRPEKANEPDFFSSSRPEWFMGSNQTLIIRRRRWCGSEVYDNAWGNDYFARLAPRTSRYETIKIEIPITSRTYRSMRDIRKGWPSAPEIVKSIKLELGYLEVFPNVASTKVTDPYTKEKLVAVTIARLNNLSIHEQYAEKEMTGFNLKYCERRDCWSK